MVGEEAWAGRIVGALWRAPHLARMGASQGFPRAAVYILASLKRMTPELVHRAELKQAGRDRGFATGLGCLDQEERTLAFCRGP